MNTVELIGLDTVKQALADLRGTYSPAQLRAILDAPGRLVVKETKNHVQFKGEIAEAFKKDLGVYRDNRKSKKDAEYVIVGPRFKNYTIRRQNQKVAVTAQHLTEGFYQTDRVTKSGERRGRVQTRVENPVLVGFEASKGQVNDSINKSIVVNLNKVKAKYRGVVQ